MKKYTIMLAVAAGAMTFVSCSKDNDIQNNKEELTELRLMVGAPTSATTRASIPTGTFNEDGKPSDAHINVQWDGNEHLSLWANSNLSTNVNMTYSAPGTYNNYAYFTGYTKQSDDTEYYVLYPYQSGAKCASESGNVYITANIPDEQEATAGTFDPNAAICAGTASYDQKSVTLAHACAFLKITIKKSFKSITVKAANSDTWYFAGDVKIQPASSGSTIVDNTNKKTTVTLKHKNGSDVAAGTYLIAIAPANSTPGLSATIDFDGTEANKKTATSTAALNLTAGTINNIGTVE